MQKKYKILFLRLDNKIGDSIVESFFIRELKRLFPQSELTLMTTADLSLFRDNPHIDHLIGISFGRKGWLNTWSKLPALRAQHFDLLIANGTTIKRKIFYTLIGAKKFISTDRCPGKHITERFANVLEELGAKNIDMSYELFITKRNKDCVAQFLEKAAIKGNHFIVFNPVGSSPDRSFSKEKIKTLLELLARVMPADYPIILLDYKNQYESLQTLCIRFMSSEILEVAELIKRSDFVLTPDTGIAHMADVFDKKMLVVYSLQRFKNEEEKNNHKICWSPRTDKADSLYTDQTIDSIPSELIIQKVLERKNK